MNDEQGYVSKFTGQVLVPVVTPQPGQHEIDGCKHCGKTFYAKRTDARFCSANCRKASSRRVSQIKREAARIRSMMDRLWKIAGDDEKLQIVAALETDAIRSKCDTRRGDTSTGKHPRSGQLLEVGERVCDYNRQVNGVITWVDLKEFRLRFLADDGTSRELTFFDVKRI